MADNKQAQTPYDIRVTTPFRSNGAATNSADIDSAKRHAQRLSYTLSDINLHPRNNYNADEMNIRKYIPVLEVNEFQPDYIFGIEQKIDKAKNVITSTAGQVLQFIKGGIQSVTNSVKQTHFEGLINETARGSNTEDTQVKIPLRQMVDMFTGHYIAKYAIPYNGNFFMSADGQEGWDIGDSGVANKIANVVKAFTVPLDFGAVPMWSLQNIATFPNVKTSFILYNDNIKNLSKNFAFVNSLIAGAYWAREGYLQRSPNVYTVIYPGKFYILYATLKIEVLEVGNKRMLNSSNLGEFINNLGMDEKGVANFAKSMFADGYEVNIDFKSLMPNNYNTFLINLLNKYDRVGIGKELDSFTEKMVDKADVAAGAINAFGSSLLNSFPVRAIRSSNEGKGRTL